MRAVTWAFLKYEGPLLATPPGEGRVEGGSLITEEAEKCQICSVFGGKTELTGAVAGVAAPTQTLRFIGADASGAARRFLAGGVVLEAVD
jgi:hypothetical protein